MIDGDDDEEVRDEEEKESGTGASTIRRCGCGLGSPPPPRFSFLWGGEGDPKAATHSRVGGEPLPDYDQTATVTPTTTTTHCVLPCFRAYLSTLSLSCPPHCRIRGAELQRGGGRISPKCGLWRRENDELQDGVDDNGTRGNVMLPLVPIRRRKYVGCNYTCLFVISHAG